MNSFCVGKGGKLLRMQRFHTVNVKIIILDTFRDEPYEGRHIVISHHEIKNVIDFLSQVVNDSYARAFCLIDAVTDITGISKRKMFSDLTSRYISDARHVAMYLVDLHSGLPKKNITNLFNRGLEGLRYARKKVCMSVSDSAKQKLINSIMQRYEELLSDVFEGAAE